jgi:hypothetical protein
LLGIPWGEKGIVATNGYNTSWKSALYQDQRFDHDATVVERLEGRAPCSWPSYRRANWPTTMSGRTDAGIPNGESMGPIRRRRSVLQVNSILLG